MVHMDMVMEEPSEDMVMVGANTVRLDTAGVEAVIVMGAALIQMAVMEYAIKIILDSCTDLEVMIVMEDKVVKNATKEAVILVNLAVDMEEKELYMEDTKIQDMAGMIFVTKEVVVEIIAVL